MTTAEAMVVRRRLAEWGEAQDARWTLNLLDRWEQGHELLDGVLREVERREREGTLREG